MINLICLINLSFRVSKSTAKHVKISRDSFRRFLKNENSIANPADFSFKAVSRNMLNREL